MKLLPEIFAQAEESDEIDMLIKAENIDRKESFKKRSYSISKGLPLVNQNSIVASQISRSPSQLDPIGESQKESSNENFEKSES